MGGTENWNHNHTACVTIIFLERDPAAVLSVLTQALQTNFKDIAMKNRNRGSAHLAFPGAVAGSEAQPSPSTGGGLQVIS